MYLYLYIYRQSVFSGRFSFLLPSSLSFRKLYIHTQYRPIKEKNRLCVGNSSHNFSFFFLAFFFLLFSNIQLQEREKKRLTLLQQLLILIIYDRYKRKGYSDRPIVARHNYTSMTTVLTNNRAAGWHHFNLMYWPKDNRNRTNESERSSSSISLRIRVKRTKEEILYDRSYDYQFSNNT
jgi:hypothetical protein